MCRGTDKEILGSDEPLTTDTLNHHRRVKRGNCRRRVGGTDGDAAARPEHAMFAIHALRRVRITGVAAGPIAGKTATVIPAARILHEVAAERPDVSYLRAGHDPGRRNEQPVIAPQSLVADDFAKRGRGADLDTVFCIADAAKCRDAVQVDHRLRMFGAVLEPAVSVLPTAQQPAVFCVAVGEIQCIVELCRLVELNVWHNVERSHLYLTRCLFAAACRTARVLPRD